MIISDLHRRHPVELDHPALCFHDRKISFAQLEHHIEQYARYLTGLGLRPGERVAIALPNCPEFIYAYLGIVRAGGVVVPLNLLQAPQELYFIVLDSGAKFLFTNSPISQHVKQFPDLPLQLVVLDEALQEKIMKAPAVDYPEIDEEQVCTFLYTSGTTGKPKAAMLTHANLLGDVLCMDRASGFGREENFLAVLPMFHSFGWTVCVLLPLYVGCTITILDGFRPREILQFLSEEGITVLCGVPSMFTVLLRLRQKTHFPKLRFAISGGDSISRENMEAFEKTFNFPIIEGYGLSEASPVVCLNPLYGVRKIGSIGIPLPGIDCKVVDDEDRELPFGEVGELLVRGPNVMKGYYKRDKESQEALRGGWLHTGDLAYRDSDGYFYIAGRKKELIITGGFNVYPREVEEALAAHPSVAEAAVIGIPHPLKGESIKAFIVLEAQKSLEKQEIIRFLRERLANYKMPEEFVFTEDFPRGTGGKILKRMLQ